MKSLVLKIFICVLICLALGLLSGFSTVESISNWYRFINKPVWNPPNWVFGPVWTLLYIMMGISLALVWHTNHQNKKRAVTFFVIQFVLNIAWSFIFFNLHAIGWAFAEIIIMLTLIAITMAAFYKISKPAAWLMLPYLIWVSFATILNGSIWYLNS
ncbi:MAG: TspO/MBR family protein [Ferruginibacter sp.]